MKTLTAELRQQYIDLFTTCVVRRERVQTVDAVVDRAVASRPRYAAVSDTLGCPWYLVAVIHCLEASLKFDRHLHNGDPLTARTVLVPVGRPSLGDAPFSWEDSARDALRLKRIHEWSDWTVPGTLFKLESTTGGAIATTTQRYCPPTCGASRATTRRASTWPTESSTRMLSRASAERPHCCADCPTAVSTKSTATCRAHPRARHLRHFPAS